MCPFKNYRSHVVEKESGVGKSTLFETPRLLLGLNSLDPGVEQAIHTHEHQDKFYHVVEGRGTFTVAYEVREVGHGYVVWAPAGVEHGVRNDSDARLVLLVGISPAP